jgi:endonuclease/exonuclease/phosphatase family metal-dependent hydrolase
MHRILSDLTPILDRGRGQPEVLIGGDFNCTTQWEVERDRLMDGTVFNRLRAYGLQDLIAERFDAREQLPDCFCPTQTTCTHVRTLRHRDYADSRPFQCDYLFATPALAQACTVSLLDSDDIWATSDHCAVLATTAARE